MPRNDQAVRQLVILNKLEVSRQGLTLGQLAEAIDPAATRIREPFVETLQPLKRS